MSDPILDAQLQRVLAMFADQPDTPERAAERKAFLAELGALWAAVPSQRFGQLIMNISRDEQGRFPEDFWNWSLETWRNRMRLRAKEYTSGP